jgi:AAA domain
MSNKRFKRGFTCPICGGHDNQERGRGKRCHGFLSNDIWAHCAREEFAGGITINSKSDTYAHLLYGDCNCGMQHNPPQDDLGGKPKTPGIKSMKTNITETYDYFDEHGELLYQVCRKEPKSFLQRQLLEQGGWMYSLEGVRRVPYRLPELLAADTSATVFICEGEKDVDALREFGLVATTNAGGAGKWKEEYSEHLRGRNVVILPDNDKPGQEHAESVARSLRGIAANVKVVSLPGLPEKGDVSDWLNAGGTVEGLKKMANEASPDESATFKSKAPKIQSAAELLAREFPEPKYAVYGLLSEGVTIFAGKPKTGKSWLALGVAIAVASGGRVLGTIPVLEGDALYLSLEDGARRVQERLKKLLANGVPKRLSIATEWANFEDGGLADLEAWIKEHPEARLIVIDTLKRVRPKSGKTKLLYDSDYEALAPLGDLARSYGVSIVVVHHTRKQESDDPFDLISGSNGLTGSADGAMVLKRSRGQAQAELHVTGRDFDEQSLALSWDNKIHGWSLLGDASEFGISKERREVIEMLRLETTATPKQAAEILKKEHNAMKKLMAAMAKDGQLHNDGSGRYSLPVTEGSSSNSGNSSNPTLFGNSGNSESEEAKSYQSYQSYPTDTLFGDSGNPSNTTTATVVSVMRRSTLPVEEFFRVEEDEQAA